MENNIYYILIDSLKWSATKTKTIEIKYSNGLNNIQRQYKIGEDIPTLINLEDE